MTAITSLPNELLEKISNYLDFKDFKNFTYVSKKLYLPLFKCIDSKLLFMTMKLNKKNYFMKILNNPLIDLQQFEFKKLNGLSHSTFFYWAIKNNYFDVFVKLLRKKLDPSIHNNLPIIMACEYGHIDMVNELLKDYRVNPAAQSDRAILEASRYGHLSVVKKLLLDIRVDPSSLNNYAIKEACRFGRAEIVNFLLADPRIDAFDNNSEALCWASQNGHLNCVKELLSSSLITAISTIDSLIWAFTNERYDIIKYLLEDGRVDPSEEDNFCIQQASRKGYVEIVRILLEDHRVDPTANENYALIWSIRLNYDDITELLISDIRLKNYNISGLMQHYN